MQNHNGLTALVTGAGRAEGIGFEVCRQLGARGYTVFLTARSLDTARARADDLALKGLDVRPLALDVTSEVSLAAASSAVADAGRLDVLINNAAATTAFGEKALSANLEAAHSAMESILFGAWRAIQAFLPLLRQSPAARVVNVSSGAGSHGDTVFGLTSDNAMGPGYGVAKAALNALTAAVAFELKGSGILVNAVCPGFTATFPGGDAMGARPVREGAAGIVWAATLPAGGPSGSFYRDGKPLPW
jgi:NAD(P)-dependent dehydrogenase (short-subunit alcohol dehydrogenase family)